MRRGNSVKKKKKGKKKQVQAAAGTGYKKKTPFLKGETSHETKEGSIAGGRRSGASSSDSISLIRLVFTETAGGANPLRKAEYKRKRGTRGGVDPGLRKR